MVNRDASQKFGKPYVYLKDLVSAAQSVADGAVLVANADILVELSDVARELIFNRKEGQFAAFKRTDIDSVVNTSLAMTYLHFMLRTCIKSGKTILCLDYLGGIIFCQSS